MNALWSHGTQWLSLPNPWPQSTFEGEDHNQTLQEERKPHDTTPKWAHGEILQETVHPVKYYNIYISLQL